jgi:hypothetical protein
VPVSRANRSVAVLSSLDHTAITEQFFDCNATGLTSHVLFRLQWIFCHPQEDRQAVFVGSIPTIASKFLIIGNLRRYTALVFSLFCAFRRGMKTDLRLHL